MRSHVKNPIKFSSTAEYPIHDLVIKTESSTLGAKWTTIMSTTLEPVSDFEPDTISSTYGYTKRYTPDIDHTTRGIFDELYSASKSSTENIAPSSTQDQSFYFSTALVGKSA